MRLASTVRALGPVLLLALASGCAGPAETPSPAGGDRVDGGAAAAASSSPEPSAGAADRAADPAAPGVVIGRVLELDEPRAGTLVQLAGADGTLLQATVDAQGDFQISDVPPGDYLLNIIDVHEVRGGVMTMKTRGVTVGPGQLVDETVVFGTGHRVHGALTGFPEGVAKLQIVLYRPGAPKLEGTKLSDRRLQIEAAKYLAETAYVEIGASAYEILDVEPGTYRLVLTVPPDPATPRSALWPMPLHEAEVTVEHGDVEAPIAIRGR